MEVYTIGNETIQYERHGEVLETKGVLYNGDQYFSIFDTEILYRIIENATSENINNLMRILEKWKEFIANLHPDESKKFLFGVGYFFASTDEDILNTRNWYNYYPNRTYYILHVTTTQDEAFVEFSECRLSL